VSRNQDKENAKPKIIFITGGARSGKSTFALKESEKIADKKAFIAPAAPVDAEMEDRIRLHRLDRGEEWDTIEEPLNIAHIIEEMKDKYGVILIDCLTLWISNVILRDAGAEQEKIQEAIDVLMETIGSLKERSDGGGPLSKVIIVSNEVGMGIVPENPLARLFRDMAGRLNQRVAEIADEVYLAVSGIPVKIKG
jgi:adenosylcobinamide kinase/adenosylcobinamide-phosphate guanylyltransferase